MSRRVAIVAAKRTPIGKFLGAFADTPAVELGVRAARAVLEESGVAPGDVDDVVFGHARQAGCGPNPGRQVSVRAGIPEERPAQTMNAACGSGLKSIAMAADAIRLGEAECVLAGGMENMTRVPFLLDGARRGYRLGHAPLVDGMYRDGFHCPLADMVMGETAEVLAAAYAVGREEQDRFALTSQERTAAAIGAGTFTAEIAPVRTRDRKGREVLVAADEHPRPGVTMEALAALPPVFEKSGTITAGNASGITDAAAAVLVVSEERARALGIEPLAWVRDFAAVGVDPVRMGIGPVPATRRILERNGLTIDNIPVVELNEAFAAQVLACQRDLGFDASRVNPNGGAISLGHPIGCTGTRIVVTLLHEMVRRGHKRGLATLCVSGGLGMAMLFERD
ncbi:MAG: thiolase family protein [Candidatus Krumholzibacteria bacterium]|nr:thiolase family protein [Candidatus Krumholzibacteria bacterium]